MFVVGNDICSSASRSLLNCWVYKHQESGLTWSAFTGTAAVSTSWDHSLRGSSKGRNSVCICAASSEGDTHCSTASDTPNTQGVSGLVSERYRLGVQWAAMWHTKYSPPMEYNKALCFSYHYRITVSIPKTSSAQELVWIRSVQGVPLPQSKWTGQGQMEEGSVRAHPSDAGCSGYDKRQLHTPFYS